MRNKLIHKRTSQPESYKTIERKFKLSHANGNESSEYLSDPLAPSYISQPNQRRIIKRSRVLVEKICSISETQNTSSIEPSYFTPSQIKPVLCEEYLSWGESSGHNPCYRGPKTCGLSSKLGDGCIIQALHDDGRMQTTSVK